MNYNWAVYRSATGCHRYGPAGPQAVLLYLEDRFPGQVSMGICNCRVTNGGSSWSHHAECRAYDEGFAVFVGQTIGIKTLELVGPHGARLGFDHMIMNHEPGASGRGDPRIYSARSPQGRVYTGAHPHKNHNHIGLTRNAAANLTYATLVDVLGPAQPDEEYDDMLGFDIGRKDQPSVEGEMAGALQAMLVARGFDLGSSGPNGDGVDKKAGNITRSAFHNWKISVGITSTTSAGSGKVGVYEYANLHAAPVAGDTFDHSTLAPMTLVKAIGTATKEAIDAHAALTHSAHHP